jgi:hypothetical protein
MAAATFDVVEIATQAAEAAGALGSVFTGFQLLSVAKDYYQLYAQQRYFYQVVFQYGVEAPLIDEVMSIPSRRYDYNAQLLTVFDDLTGPLAGFDMDTFESHNPNVSGDTGGWWTRRAQMYYADKDPIITALPADRARLESDWANYLFRFEEHYTDIMNDIRFNKRLGVHNIGLKQGAYVSAALSTSFGNYEDALDGTADSLSATANGAAAYSGYRQGRSDTNDAFNATTYRQNSATRGDTAQGALATRVGPPDL